MKRHSHAGIAAGMKKLALASALSLGMTSLAHAIAFEVWMSDQGTTHDSVAPANSVTNLNSPTTTSGGYLRIYQGAILQFNAASATPENYHINGEGVVAGDKKLMDYTQFGAPANWGNPAIHGASVPKLRGLHGCLPSPNHRYMACSILNGFVAIISDGRTPVALFRVTGTNTATGGNPHMSFFSNDGKYLLVANQNARMLERIDLTWDSAGVTLVSANYNKSASLDLVGGSNVVGGGRLTREADTLAAATISATNPGTNIGSVSGSYDASAFSTTLPDGSLKQTGTSGSRPNNSVICPLAMDNNQHTVVTMAGGGAFIVDHTTTPMKIVAAYDKTQIADAGCGGLENAGYMYLDQGTSVAPTSAPWSCPAGQATDRFSVYRLPSTGWPSGGSYLATPPKPFVMQDLGASMCTTTALARDAHGMTWGDYARNYLHVWDRFQNQIRVYKMPVGTLQGIINIGGGAVCTDPTPDLGDYVFVPAPNATYTSLKPRTYMAHRGSGPLSFGHAASGNCGGLGIYAIDNGGTSATLEFANTTTIPVVATDVNGNPTNRGAYTGPATNTTDPHAVAVRIKSF
ncbi:MAG: hypothetical protein LDL19_04325 [Thiobacillus sp.]|nr:hypothetical protein [Thiobacillus sp.]